MSGDLVTLAGALFGASLAAVLLVGVCALLLVGWKRLPPRLGAALWWLVALRILLELAGISAISLPLLPAASRIVAPASESTGVALPASAPASGNQAGRADLELATPTATGRGFVDTRIRRLVLPGVALVWLAGLAIVIALELRRWTRLAAVVRRARSAADPRVRVAWAKASAALGLERRVPLLVSEEIATPMIVGLLRPQLLLPASAALAGEELRLVLLHELAHVRRHDALLALVPTLARRLFWFHPMVRFAEREFTLATEAACDAEVLAHTGAEPSRYGRLLVRFAAARDEGLVPALAFAAHPLERRVRMLVTTPLDRRRLLLAAPVVLLVALAVALPVRLVAAPSAPPAPPAAAAAPAPPSPPARAAEAAEPAEAAELADDALPVPPAPPSAPMPPAPPARAALPALPALSASPLPPAPPAPSMPPLPALPALAPMPPMPPAPPFWSQLDPGDAIVFRDGDTSFVVNASRADRRRVEELAADGQPVALIRRDGVTRVIRDRASIDEIRAWIEEATRLERQGAEEMRANAERLRAELDGRFSGQRAEIEQRARELAERARELAAQESVRAQGLAIVDGERTRDAAVQEAERAGAATRRSVESAQRSIERAQREMARQAAQADRDVFRDWGRDWGREWGRELGRAQRATGRQLRDLLDQLAGEGRAEEPPK